MTKAVGTKKKSAAMIHRLMEDVPLWAAAAIQRGPSTAAMLNSKTSHRPISRRSCFLTSGTCADCTFRSIAKENVGYYRDETISNQPAFKPLEFQHAQECTMYYVLLY